MVFTRMLRTLAVVNLSLIIIFYSESKAAETEKTVSFSKEEVELLRDVMSRDKFLKELSNAHSGLAALNKVLAIATPGPLKLPFKWNQTLFDSWRKANDNLAKIGKLRICDDLLAPIINNSPNSSFFEHLRTTRGCDE